MSPQGPKVSKAALNFIVGDATKQAGTGAKIIVHVCNDLGAWGAGFVLALSRRWSEPEEEYRKWSQGETAIPFALGQVQIVRVAPDIEVANLIGQHGIRRTGKLPPIRYDAVERGLGVVASHCMRHSASVHMPRIGCGLAGGKWPEIESLILTQLIAKGVRVTVYDLE